VNLLQPTDLVIPQRRSGETKLLIMAAIFILRFHESARSFYVYP
jgi:hypothetical protein